MAEITSVAEAFHDDLVDLVRQAQDGSDEAAQAVFDRCRGPLLAVIRQVIFRPLRRLFDSDDLLLSAFAEVFTRHFSDEVLRSPATLWPYLKRIAENKVRDAGRKYLVTRRHDIRRDIPLDLLTPKEEPVSKNLSPEDLAIFNELVDERLDHLLGQLRMLDRAIVQLVLRGQLGVAIAARLGLNPKDVYKRIKWLKNRILTS
jgi:DNA-directed RNA polymerase specialized sigma24 family protein